MRILSFIVLAVISLYGNQDDLDSLLDTFTQNSDLSHKTKLENSGISYIFTRQDLEMMQVKELKDVLKMINYKQSAFGLSDPNYNKELAFPFNSSSIRLFINNFEVTSTVYGSGIAEMGDIDLSFINHIEIYILNPSFEFTTESTTVLIKLFSVDSKRDKGGKLLVSLGSRGYTQNSLVYANKVKDWSFTTSISYTDDKRKRYQSLNEPLSRDNVKKHLFLTLKKDYHSFQGGYFKKDSDAFINMSLDATPTVDDVEYQSYSLGYENSYLDNIRFLINYEQEDSFGHFADNNLLVMHPVFGPVRDFSYKSDNSVLTSEIKYNYSDEKNDLLVGIKYRDRTFNSKGASFNGIAFPNSSFDRQTFYSAYFENQFTIDESNVINFGYQSSKVKQNGNYSDYNIHLLRMGYTYSLKDFTAKLYYFNSKLPVEPYILQTGRIDSTNPLKSLQNDSVALELKYKNNKHLTRAILSFTKTDNGVKLDTRTRKYINLTNSYNTISPTVEYSYSFDAKNKLLANLRYKKIDSKSLIDETKQWNGFIRLLNSYNDFDFFNEITYDHDRGYKHYYNYSLGADYRYSDTLSISLKGENVLDKAYEVEYQRIDPTRFPLSTMESLFISTIDPRVIVSLKYYF